MDLILVDDYEALSHAGADWLAEAVQAKRDASIVLATGESPMGVYRELAERRSHGQIDASGLRVFQLDAYVGLAPDDRRSLFGWMRRSFLEPLGVSESNTVRLEGNAPDLERACRAYEDVPRQALTCGMDLLLAAPRTLLVVSGAHKHEILHRMLEGPQTPEVPASYLQSASNVTVLVDRAAWQGSSTPTP